MCHTIDHRPDRIDRSNRPAHPLAKQQQQARFSERAAAAAARHVVEVACWQQVCVETRSLGRGWILGFWIETHGTSKAAVRIESNRMKSVWLGVKNAPKRPRTTVTHPTHAATHRSFVVIPTHTRAPTPPTPHHHHHQHRRRRRRQWRAVLRWECRACSSCYSPSPPPCPPPRPSSSPPQHQQPQQQGLLPRACRRSGRRSKGEEQETWTAVPSSGTLAWGSPYCRAWRCCSCPTTRGGALLDVFGGGGGCMSAHTHRPPTPSTSPHPPNSYICMYTCTHTTAHARRLVSPASASVAFDPDRYGDKELKVFGGCK